MSIFDKLFGSQQPATPAAPAAGIPTQPGNLNPGAPSGDPANPTLPNGAVDASKKDQSPLDQFTQLWEPVAVDPNAPKPEPLVNFDPKQVAEAAKKLDFSKLVTPDQMQAITAGGEGAAQAFMQAMNSVAQGAFAQSMFANSKMTEQAVAKAQAMFENMIPAHVKKLTVSDNLRSENPVFNHPAASPILGAIEAQMSVKFPNASPTELTALAKQYLENFADAVKAPSKAAEEKKQQASNKDTDWSNFL